MSAANDDDQDRTAMETRAAELFAASVGRLDARDTARLLQARRKALGAGRVQSAPSVERRAWRVWAPAMGLAAAAVAAVGIVTLGRRSDNASHGGSTLEDMDLLASEDDLDIMQDLDFYAWLDDADNDAKG